jgi:hypothetical protein
MRDLLAPSSRREARRLPAEQVQCGEGPLKSADFRAVFRATLRPSAIRATVRCWTTIASSAHRSPRRDNFTRGSAARVVSWRHTCEHSAHR